MLRHFNRLFLAEELMKNDVTRNEYKYFYPLATRWHDNDIYGHVNNVVYYSYFDTAANRYLIEECGMDIQSDSTVGFVVTSNCEYLSPITYPNAIDVGFRVNRLGNKSVEYGLAVFVEGRDMASAVGSFTHVFVNREEGSSVVIPKKIRVGLELALNTRD